MRKSTTHSGLSRCKGSGGLLSSFFALSLFPLSQLKKKLAEVRTHNGQACVTDQLPPTPRPVDKSSFVHCILGGTPWVCPGPARECSANFFPNRSHGSGPSSGPSCANPGPDKNQCKKGWRMPSQRTIILDPSRAEKLQLPEKQDEGPLSSLCPRHS